MISKKRMEILHFVPGAFRLTSYEWGVTYAGMLLAAKRLLIKNMQNYANKRLAINR